MEIRFSKSNIILNQKEITTLDKLVIKFIAAMGNVDYVIVSGYIAIFFGRIRGTEDIDILINKMDMKQIKDLHERLLKSGFEPVNNVENAKEAYELLSEGSSLRYAEKGTWAPNFELKFVKKPLDRHTMDNKIKIIFNGKYSMYISPIELQIAFKLWLGSDKDYEDARYIYNIFKAYIDVKKLNGFLSEFHVKKIARKVLGELDGKK
ncbi:MAG: hypothetical protein QXY86_03075 [Candidatus Micrarchaeaceae archaeon]